MGLKRYLLGRIIESIITFFLAITLIFVIFRLMPGDPVSVLASEVWLSPAARQRILERFGLDRPLLEQYVKFIVNLFQGEFGVSYAEVGTPVLAVIGRRLMNTVALVGMSMVISVTGGFLLGIIAAWKRQSKVDVLLSTLSNIVFSMPIFWMGMLILMFFAVYLRIIPVGGSSFYKGPLLGQIADYLYHLMAPALVTAVHVIASYVIKVRAVALEIFNEDYITTAESKGLSDRKILFRHVGKNTLLPVVSELALRVPVIVSGVVLVETVFSWNGLGYLTFRSVYQHDYPVLQGIFVIMAIVVIAANFIADILYGVLDPRVKLTRG